ncbi:NADH dehydrogenase [ubiquinone] 1 alpha subcomplex subunit 5-like [Oscarella lobularis]|uniref:NADH dehydrogenase [ubiquinone] 1 alpha subcomplex subunit 5-like n=1 Tax=Oscarella lobularis TaxID=121494 RepID=UPI0033131303
MAAKKATGLVGLAVVPNAREALISIYQRTLQALSTIPKEAAYRKNVEEITNDRLKVVEKESNVETIESKIGAGQVEELLKQAEGELNLVSKMKEWKPWEPIVSEAPANQWTWP